MSVPQQPNIPPYASTNAVGRAGLILGVAALGASLITSVAVQFMVRSNGYAMISVVSGIGSFLALIAAAAALVLGIIGLRKVGFPHGEAGIATGLGIAGVVGGVFSFLLNFMASLSY